MIICFDTDVKLIHFSFTCLSHAATQLLFMGLAWILDSLLQLSINKVLWSLSALFNRIIVVVALIRFVSYWANKYKQRKWEKESIKKQQQQKRRYYSERLPKVQSPKVLKNLRPLCVVRFQDGQFSYPDGKAGFRNKIKPRLKSRRSNQRYVKIFLFPETDQKEKSLDLRYHHDLKNQTFIRLIAHLVLSTCIYVNER